MIDKFYPEINKVYFINRHSMFHILEGEGSIQVDFNNYPDWDDKLVFLEKGQYIKFLADNFVVRKIEFTDEALFKHKDIRILFKHLISLGYINFSSCDDCQRFLDEVLLKESKDILDVSSKQWYWQNPFNAQPEEYHIIFDIKDLIDQEYKNQLSNDHLVRLLSTDHIHAHSLVKDKVGLSIKSLFARKRLVEIQKEIAFTEKPIKEISYDFGYKDPAYFNRLYKNKLGTTPLNFRREQDFSTEDHFISDLLEIIDEFHTENRSIGFYADKMHLTEKNLAEKVRQRLNTSLGQLIRSQVIRSAKKLLKDEFPIQEIAYQLGFNEANHFSSFFKHYTGNTPSEFKDKKYNR
jgi:AraC-like DNA-binding protein